MHRKVAAALLAALALGIAGCGGSEETLTRAQLTRRIEAACRLAQKTQESQMRGSRRSGAATFLGAVLAGQKVAMDRIEDLHPSDAVQSQFDAFKQGMQDRIDLFEKIDEANGNASVQRAIAAAAAAGEAITRRLTVAARRLGVEGCV